MLTVLAVCVVGGSGEGGACQRSDNACQGGTLVEAAAPRASGFGRIQEGRKQAATKRGKKAETAQCNNRHSNNHIQCVCRVFCHLCVPLLRKQLFATFKLFFFFPPTTLASQLLKDVRVHVTLLPLCVCACVWMQV